MLHVADTHALIWFLTRDNKLGSNAKEIFQKTEEGETIIVVSVISLLEIL